jgi:hypothetical protein
MEGRLQETKSGNDLIDSFALEYAYTFTETAFVDRRDLRRDNDASPRQAAFTRLEHDDAGLRRSIDIGTHGAHDNRRYSGVIEDIILDDDVWMRNARNRASGFVRPNPEYFSSTHGSVPRTCFRFSVHRASRIFD